MKQSKSKMWIATLLISGIVVTLFFLLLPVIKGYLIQFLEWLQGVGTAGVIAFAVVYVLTCIFFIPGSILTLGAGFAFGVILGTITVSLASIVGASAAFILGRTLARSLIEAKVQSNPKFQAIDAAVGHQGFKIVLLTRLSPAFPFNLLNYAFGLTKVSFKKYFFASWIGMFPGTVMYVYLGSALKSVADLAAGKVQGGIAQTVLFVVGLMATVAVTVFVTRIAKKALHESVSEESISPAPSSE